MSEPIPTRMIGPHWGHQGPAIRFALDRPGSVMHVGMGAGKSRIAVGVAVESGARRVLVLCPAAATGVWLREFAKHSTGFEILIAGKGDTARRAAQIVTKLKLAIARKEAIVVVVNHEASWREPLGMTLRGVPWDLTVFDESHRLKNNQGRASLHASKIRLVSRRRIALTGTLAPHSPMDLWAQFRAVDPRVFQKTFTEFRIRYGVTAREAEAVAVAAAMNAARENGVDPEAARKAALDRRLEALREQGKEDSAKRKLYGVLAEQIVEYKNVEELRQRYRSITFTRTTAECVDLPGVIEQEIPVELSTKARKLYDEVERELYGEVDEGQITAANALVKLLRLQQLAGGFAAFDDGTATQLCTCKLDALADFLEDTPRGRPVVVFSRFSPDVEGTLAIGERLGLRCGEISGRRKDLTEHAQIPDGIDLMAVQLQSGGVAVDLTKARIAIYLSRGFSLPDFLQSRARLDRPGQDSVVLIYHLISDTPVERKVIRGLKLRQDLIKAVLDDRSDGLDDASKLAREVA